MVNLLKNPEHEVINNSSCIEELLLSCLTIKQSLRETIRLFKDADLDSPRLDAELLLADANDCSPIDLYIDQDLQPDESRKIHFATLVKKRLSRMPIQYILGHTEFMSLDFLVNNNVLIPRPETELLVEAVIDIVNNRLGNHLESTRFNQEECQPVRVIDLCTGSGNIAISIAAMIENSAIYASDISIDALNVAVANAKRHKVDDKIVFLQGNVFNAFKENGIELKADFVVSNPPYVGRNELNSLQPEVIKYEPNEALVGGDDGYDFLKIIIAEASDWIRDGGYLILEIAEGQLKGILEIINICQKETGRNVNGFKFLNSVKDLQGIDRIVIAQKI